jgi:hypothetical protein
MTETLPCDECGTDTTDPTWCDHSRVACPRCLNECNQCRREAQSDARGRL